MKQTLTFYNSKTRTKFETSEYTVKLMETKKGPRYFAIAKTDEGKDSCRIISKTIYEEALKQ